MEDSIFSLTLTRLHLAEQAFKNNKKVVIGETKGSEISLQKKKKKRFSSLFPSFSVLLRFLCV